MTNMRNYLAWIKQNQQNNPEWRDANKWQNRNQSAIPPKQGQQPQGLPEGAEVVDETPDE